jgi:hypothetical protein
MQLSFLTSTSGKSMKQDTSQEHLHYQKELYGIYLKQPVTRLAEMALKKLSSSTDMVVTPK